MNIKDNIIIKDNFFNKDVLKKIHFDISTLKFSNRFKDIDDKNTIYPDNSHTPYQKIYFNVELNLKHFAVLEVYKNLNKLFNNEKNVINGKHFYFLSTKHKKATPHNDRADVNCLVYLKGNYLINSGTGFYDKNKDTGEYTLNTHVGFKENRAIIFDSKIFHASLQFNENCGKRYVMANFFLMKNKND